MNLIAARVPRRIGEHHRERAANGLPIIRRVFAEPVRINRLSTPGLASTE